MYRMDVEVDVALRIFLTFWLLAAALCFVGFYYAYNKGWGDSLPPSVEAIVNEPIGILILLVVFVLLGPIPIAAIKIERKKPGEPNFTIDVRTKE
jgi:drug/metabolite transporter (DMT)-like permease